MNVRGSLCLVPPSAVSWGDLFVFSGTAAILNMGGPVSSICAGRIDDVDGSASDPLDDPDGNCTVQGNCTAPLGADTVGLIYVNPAGVMGEPVPSKSAPRIREVFGRMGMNDSETVALIGGGHAFGKCHGACSLGAGDGPDVEPEDPWPGNCGSGIAENTFTSGFEGEWTHTPLSWSNEYFQQLLSDNYTLWTSPGGVPQWENQNNGLMMLTTDLALVADDEYEAIVTEFAEDITALNTAFAAAWKKLTESGNDEQWADNKFCVDADTLSTDYIGTTTESPEQDADSSSADDDVADIEIAILVLVVIIVCGLIAYFIYFCFCRESGAGNPITAKRPKTEMAVGNQSGTTTSAQISEGNL